MNRLALITIGTLLFSCGENDDSVSGHWHEFENDQLVHCYRISNDKISVDKFSAGFTTELITTEGNRTLMTVTSNTWTTDYHIENDLIEINDSVKWKRVDDTIDNFRMDLSMGLLVQIIPKTLDKEKYDLPYDTNSTIIYVGKLKKRVPKSDSTYHIQFNDVLGSTSNLKDFFESYHESNENKIAVIHADKDTPNEMLKRIIDEILKTGYTRENIYRTAIDMNKLTMGLTRVE